MQSLSTWRTIGTRCSLASCPCRIRMRSSHQRAFDTNASASQLVLGGACSQSRPRAAKTNAASWYLRSTQARGRVRVRPMRVAR